MATMKWQRKPNVFYERARYSLWADSGVGERDGSRMKNGETNRTDSRRLEIVGRSVRIGCNRSVRSRNQRNGKRCEDRVKKNREF